MGESYAGKYLPAMGYAILQDSKRKVIDRLQPKINLKGLAIGNGWTDPVNQMNWSELLYQLGSIDKNGYKLLTEMQNKVIACIKNSRFECDYHSYLDIAMTIANLTGPIVSNFVQVDDRNDVLNDGWYRFLQSPETRCAIHVGHTPFEFHSVSEGEKNIVLNHLKDDFMDSVADWVAEILSHYQVLIYSGQLDVLQAYAQTRNYLEKLKFSAADDYKTAPRYIWRVDNDMAGYVKKAGNLTEVLVRNAGKSIEN